ncbi:hypothetical protein, partial [Streptomyces sp. WAC02707]|uniref:hypothetical protein n=1 Tax=Streptomyces sp. WAC02707 TaxID=2487417 RepID=UPI001C8D02BA
MSPGSRTTRRGHFNECKKKVETFGDDSAVEGDLDHAATADVAFGYKCRVEVTAGTGAPRGRYLAGSINEAMHCSPSSQVVSRSRSSTGEPSSTRFSSAVEFGQARDAKV